VTQKLTRKELKGPDAFQRKGGEFREWLQERQKTLTFGTLGVLGVIGLGVLVNYFSSRGEVDAAKELGGELKLVSRPVEGSEMPGPPSDAKPFKTEKDKDEALVKALGDFRDKHASTHAAASAGLPLAQALFRLGKYDDALKGYDDYLKVALPDDPLRALALEGRGYCFEAKHQLDQAMTAFDELSRENRTDFLNGMGLYHRARILIAQGKKPEAARQLVDVSAAAPNSAAARMAQDRIALLASEGVAIPAPPPPLAVDAG